MVLAVQLICNLIPLQLCKKYDININDCLVTSTSSNHSNLNNFNKDMNSIGSSSSSNEDVNKPILKGRKVLFSLKLLELLCKNRNYRTGGKGGQLDYNRASKLIIDDFTQGVLLYCKKPPMLDGGYTLENEDEELFKGLNELELDRLGSLEKLRDMNDIRSKERMENGDLVSENLQVDFNRMYITNTSNVTEARYIGKTVTESKKDEENVNQWLKHQLNKDDNRVKVTKRKLRFILKGKRRTGERMN